MGSASFSFVEFVTGFLENDSNDAADSKFRVQMLVQSSDVVIITSLHQENLRFCEVSLTFEVAEDVKADISELMHKE